jgi:valyl-tRNA synthetase
VTTDAAKAAYAELAGLTVFSAKKKMVELLEASGELLQVSKPFSHPVKFYEKGDRALEIVSTRQWYLRNGARDEAFARSSSHSVRACSGIRTSCACATRTGPTA